MQVPDFFESDNDYLSPYTRFECKCVLEEHGKVYAFGLTYLLSASDTRPGVPTTFRRNDWPGAYVKVVNNV